MEAQAPQRYPQVVTCVDIIHRVCTTKSWSRFDARLSTGFSTGRKNLPVENVCAQRVTRAFPQQQNGLRLLVTGTPDPRAGRGVVAQACAPLPCESAAATAPTGYDSSMCSNTGDAIDRIMSAIDQLASDVRGGKSRTGEGELAVRVADLWHMVSDLDPELARRARRYTGPADGDPAC